MLTCFDVTTQALVTREVTPSEKRMAMWLTGVYTMMGIGNPGYRAIADLDLIAQPMKGDPWTKAD